MYKLLIAQVGLLLLVGGAATARSDEQPDPREREVRQLIERYFRTWSSQDIERYGACFLPNAAIQIADPDGRLTTLGLGPFLASQRDAHQRAAKPMTETAETIDVRFERNVARVVVYWKLSNGERDEYGYDHFTLLAASGKWRIANLLFYPVQGDQEQTPKAAARTKKTQD